MELLRSCKHSYVFEGNESHTLTRCAQGWRLSSGGIVYLDRSFMLLENAIEAAFWRDSQLPLAWDKTPGGVGI